MGFNEKLRDEMWEYMMSPPSEVNNRALIGLIANRLDAIEAHIDAHPCSSCVCEGAGGNVEESVYFHDFDDTTPKPTPDLIEAVEGAIRCLHEVNYHHHDPDNHCYPNVNGVLDNLVDARGAAKAADEKRRKREEAMQAFYAGVCKARTAWADDMGENCDDEYICRIDELVKATLASLDD